MEYVTQVFKERLQEIRSYLKLLKKIEKQIQNRLPQLGEDATTITPEQQKILYSSVYLQLYNLVESTVTLSLETLSKTIIDKRLKPIELSPELRFQWLKYIDSKNFDDLPISELKDEWQQCMKEKPLRNSEYKNHFEPALKLYEYWISSTYISEFKIKTDGGGNWDDEKIEQFMKKKLGFTLDISNKIKNSVKRPIRDNKGALKLIKDLRNNLAHGDISFVQCSEEITVKDLRCLTILTTNYLKEFINCFQEAIDSNSFLNSSE